ncbi:MAG TPA: type II secretion system protein [Candidatus Baltobacteraceae bacterium]|jgi:prepilin-type N-terminal cleavage/methylation domain-containing protein/prepilin-type processing-associated H-X9-DG protein|nr:type II secretion system protein [Candidatus Baltobacteraceae bacterium]
MKALLRAPNAEGTPVHRNRRRFQGFSLTELLVVIVVIAIMAALLMPALSKARRQIKAAACLGNQKQLGAALHMYTQDNSDRIVQMADYVTGEMIYPAGGFWRGPTPPPNWPNGSVALGAALDGLRSSNALYYYCNNTGVYHCPGDVRIYFSTPTINDPNGWGYDSYSRSQNLGGEPYNNYWGAGATYTKMSAILRPSTTFLMMEAGDWRGYNVGTWVVNWLGDDGFDWQDPPAIWHGNVSSVAFADGHGELHKWVDPAIVTAGMSAAEGNAEASWTGPTEGPDYRFVYDGYRFPGHP